MKQFWLRELPLIIFFSLAWCVTTWAGEPHLNLVGTSNGTARGDAGLLEMHRLCHATFPGSRMCTSRDIQLSVNPPALANVGGWVQPVYVPYHSEHGVFDISGIGLITEKQENAGVDFTTPRSLSCNGWSFASSDIFGLLLGDKGWTIVQCTFRARVACCGPTNPSSTGPSASTNDDRPRR